MIQNDKDPMGMAIADFWKHGVSGRLRTFSPDFDEDEIPVDLLFRELDEMPALEQHAIKLAKGKILDVGAGAGCHSLALQDENMHVTAIDISPLSVKTMQDQGVKDAQLLDFWEVKDRYDTILMLMNGIGIVGKVGNLPRFFQHLDTILAEDGILIFDSTDICYLFENEDGDIELPYSDTYYGELKYQMQYKNVKGEWFDWLFIDFDTFWQIADEHGFDAELVKEGENDDYLAVVRRKNFPQPSRGGSVGERIP